MADKTAAEYTGLKERQFYHPPRHRPDGPCPAATAWSFGAEHLWSITTSFILPVRLHKTLPVYLVFHPIN